MTATADTYTCLQCGTAAAASACDACVGTRFDPDDEDPIYGPAPTPPPPIDEEPRCVTCGASGRTCLDCGVLDLSALGRRLRHEMRDDRLALIARLRSTPRRFWKVLAHAYALEIGQTPWCATQPTEPGIVSLWAALEREAA